ncbi:hypothetical protein B0T26DRAFT_639291 [Lasiosphaeria miniovina]|uniref:Uncharacterized protein n=1 Tax=Lasiosphaeria miniovina TaxID=1954250 RepID=A0AA40B6K8_9PEZI|nr:uncharacterized protein B0T26DRAFT_639291 [Lasiosphaeria miniovina]KAK0728640.1 hypothetical protein B0T26DRAFT_639291 [Lasiosphaeria miniovina]
MAQGSLKKTATPNPGKTKPSRHAKRGAITKPKTVRTAADKLQKKYTGGMVGKTEKMLAARVGHLELIDKVWKKDKKEAVKVKGGTRKFG